MTESAFFMLLAVFIVCGISFPGGWDVGVPNQYFIIQKQKNSFSIHFNIWHMGWSEQR